MKKLEVKSGISLRGEVRIPGDKSISHRALMLGALSIGETKIEGLLLGEDPRSTAACFRALGAEISELNEEEVKIEGIGYRMGVRGGTLDAGNSGTTMRLMLGILAAQDRSLFKITGDASLESRPMSRVIKPLQQMGAYVIANDNHAPLRVIGSKLNSTHYNSPIASAQVKSCILLAGLLTEGKTSVREPSVSRDHSERMLKAFGADLNVDDTCVTITGGPQLVGQHVIVPGDISSAAFWLVAGLITPGSDLLLKNVGVNPTRTGVLDALRLMGASIELFNERVLTGEPVADLRVKHQELKACVIEGDLIPRLIDEIPVLAVAALFAKGVTVIKDAAELRVKESDRITTIATELNKLGGNVSELPDGLEITGGNTLTGTDVLSYGDHRIAMSLAIAGLNALGTTTVHDADAIAVSYPTFVSTLKQMSY